MYKQRRFALNLYNLSAFYFGLDNIYRVKVFNGCPPAGLQHLIEVLFIPIWTYTHEPGTGAIVLLYEMYKSALL